jgi:PadR family transcriptional regulator PadR
MNERCCPPTPECCDMRGMLSFHILWILSKKPLNGQEICEELRKRRGTKPTAGTIYPALKELTKKRLVKMERKGRTTIYHLSEKGKGELATACQYFCNAYGEIFREYEQSS